MRISFLGGAGTVTGSRFLVSTPRRRVLVDCGLFQGVKELRLRNREPFPADPATLDAVVLTHAHLDHSGYLPLLVAGGFRGPAYCTPATRDLCGILLPDSGHLQEEEAENANRGGYSRHRPALPLYTEREAVRSLESLRTVPFGERTDLGGGVAFRFRPAGHILGAGTVALEVEGTTVLFSGDLGRPGDPLLPPPAPPGEADYLVVESTYGNRLHPREDPEAELGEVVRRTAGRGGAVLIPSFAVGRAQTLLYHLWRLRGRGEIPDIPIYLDSPMAQRATRVFRETQDGARLGTAERDEVCALARATATVAESREIDRQRFPRIVISASGMATGGRVLHHLEALAPDPKNTILFAGYQAAGTRGADLVAGAAEVKVHGRYVPVRAEVEVLDGLSAHADYEEILAWLGGAARAPERVFLTHGEPAAADALRRRVAERLGWRCHVPAHGETVELGAAVGAA